jgi:hypothetical protein
MSSKRSLAQRHCVMTVSLSRSGLLFLTQTEVERLAYAFRQELVCRTTTQANEPVVVADISLTVAEAWELIDRLQCVAANEAIDWANEGF